MTSVRALLAAARAVLSRPSLWGTALVELRRFTPARWWRRRPFLPVPDAALLRFRAVTQYGDPTRPLVFTMARLGRIEKLTGLVDWYGIVA